MAANRRPDWRNGPEIPNQFTGEDNLPSYPGEFLGMPENGPGSQASVMRRMGGVFIDWAICAVAASLIVANTDALGDRYTLTYLLWIVLGILCGWLFARTPGMAVLGMGVARVDEEAPVGFWRAAVRTILTGFVLPAALVDADGRGMHDRATTTTVIRS
ncbi:RDD family protein [Corynebacterium lujinxingii]|uniref:RDD family protein n=1 Tax=Corynebacterium lujinxingii TaxID=2763010 RepID=A0A7H0JXA9_9CORY|nr:RDD family protein [Corynebacterium lujinxingii]MBC3177896.1 RDD family protein [Corynebacterium lujinxingii]NNO09861.1 RDD family protein [Corynebacterium lujinxingii]QNP89675.1 RDD family protein [Corynebacterium lujinxingii]